MVGLIFGPRSTLLGKSLPEIYVTTIKMTFRHCLLISQLIQWLDKTGRTDGRTDGQTNMEVEIVI